jgi:hypothetical protein
VAGRDGIRGPSNSSARDRTRILTPDSSSRGSIWPFGRKCSRLGRICSGSRDRPVLGHLCTNRPQNACSGTARVRERAYAHGRWAAGPAHWVWGTAGKQQHVSHAHLGRAAASQKALLRAADKAQRRPLDDSCNSCCAASPLHADQLEWCALRGRSSVHLVRDFSGKRDFSLGQNKVFFLFLNVCLCAVEHYYQLTNTQIT